MPSDFYFIFFVVNISVLFLLWKQCWEIIWASGTGIEIEEHDSTNFKLLPKDIFGDIILISGSTNGSLLTHLTLTKSYSRHEIEVLFLCRTSDYGTLFI